jgi:acetyl-CoA carboxylase biotin carboxyl carrier protein
VEAEISGFLTRIRLKRAVGSVPTGPAPDTASQTVASAPIAPLEKTDEQPPSEPSEENTPKEGSENKGEKGVPDEALMPIQSPMVGTFYRAPAPGAPPYVEVGQFISQGDVVCIVEAMKLMNEIESEISGRVRKILVENAQPVEFGQVLMLIEEHR